MLTITEWLSGVKRNASRVKVYRLGGDGSIDGMCDCVGLLIGALRLLGVKYSGIHGSNYFARYYTRDLHRVTRAAQLHAGDIVYKAHAPGETGYDAAIINSRYKKSGDKNDYYHVGVIMSVSPLCIAHCSTGGMHYDSKLGKWSYAGTCKEVATEMAEDESTVFKPGDSAVVDVPNDGTLNVRADPRINGRIVTRIREGEPVEITEVDGEWVRVKFTVGYVQSKFLRGEQ